MTSMHLSHISRWLLQSPPVEWANLRLRNLLVAAISQGPVPEHIALVMDGNRRFARNKQIETVEGHNLGFEALAKVLEICYKCGVRVVTVYAFSIENFKRTRREVDGLMALAELKLAQLMQHNGLLQRYGIRIRVLGRRDLVRADLRADIERAERATARHARAVLNVCFPYTSRDEITGAVRGVVAAWSRPLPPPDPLGGAGAAGRSPPRFSQTHISNCIRSRRLSSASPGAARAQRSSESLRVPTATSRSPSSADERASTSAATEVISDAEDSATLSTAPTAQQPTTPPDADVPLPADDAKLRDAAPSAFDPLPADPEPSPASSSPSVAEPASTYPDPETIDAAALDAHLFTAGTPPVDLLIRTSGVARLSDFLLWQVHERTEIVFLRCLWPEFDLWNFLPVLVEWQWRRRRETKERADGGGGGSGGGGWGLGRSTRRRGRGEARAKRE